MKTLAERFWSKVQKGHPDACWIWLASKRHTGHGRFDYPGRKTAMPAHRMSWILTNPGEIIPPDRFVLHRCNNASCVNPRHLYVGTKADNALDSIAAGTHNWSVVRPAHVVASPEARARGETHGNAILTEAIVRRARKERAAGVKVAVIARALGYKRRTISAVVNGRLWKHVT